MSDKTRPVSTSPETLQVAHALKPGDVLMEYVIERTLGGGGFGITYLAQDVNLNLPVAVKEYLPSDLALRSADNSIHPLGDAFKEQFDWGLERFLSEARVLATFRHPNIVRVLRYFMANGTAYIVMEYESGQSLKHWFPLQGSLTQASLLKILFPLLDGLEVIHAADFLHRDIKPDNIYIRDDGSPVLIDFGSARSTSTERELTNIVSPGFAPFEQYHSKGNQGPWTDLYSLAAVMYWLISGTKPQDSLSRLKQDTMVPAMQCSHKGQFNEGLLKAIDWALNPEEARRPQNVAALRQRLQSSLDGDRSIPITEISGRFATLEANRPVAGSENSGRNLVCSILFMDIVAYSQTSVNKQYELKSQFNQLIAEKLGHIPENSRITLDTGDGAAICFLGDPEEVLHASVEIKQTLLAQEELQVRMGLHIGPVRIISDLNGRDNVIGDGINVAQRVMSFADSNALVASRAFYEIVARLTDRSARSFKYLGERRDKHDRAHEIYSISTGGVIQETSEKTILFSGIPADKTALLVDSHDQTALDFELVAGETDENGGKTGARKTATFAQRIKAGVLGTGSLLKKAVLASYGLFRKNTSWWKLALATLAACAAGYFLGGTMWGVGAGLTATILGGAIFIRKLKKAAAANLDAESDGQEAPAAALGSGARVRTIALAVLPSIALIALLWALADTESAKEENSKPMLVESAGQTLSLWFDVEARQNLEKAQKMLAEKNYKAAISLSSAVLEKHPANLEAQEIHKEAQAALVAKEAQAAKEARAAKEAAAKDAKKRRWFPF